MKLVMGVYAEADAEVTYGAFRLRLAEHFGIEPEDVTAEHIVEYDRMRESK